VDPAEINKKCLKGAIVALIGMLKEALEDAAAGTCHRAIAKGREARG